MKITTDHPTSEYGIPVILDDRGKPMDYKDGVKSLREKLGVTQAQFGPMVNRSRRTVENWECGRLSPGREALYEMAKLLD